MSDYVSIFDPVPWDAVGRTVLQTVVVYWVVLLGLKMVGRRVFADLAPQDLVILMLVAEACDLGLSDEGAGFWGSLATVVTILAMGGVIERIKPLRAALQNKPAVLYEKGEIKQDVLKRFMVEPENLDQTARVYGLDGYRNFDTITLEGDGSITGTVKLELRNVAMRDNKQAGSI